MCIGLLWDMPEVAVQIEYAGTTTWRRDDARHLLNIVYSQPQPMNVNERSNAIQKRKKEGGRAGERKDKCLCVSLLRRISKMHFTHANKPRHTCECAYTCKCIYTFGYGVPKQKHAHTRTNTLLARSHTPPSLPNVCVWVCVSVCVCVCVCATTPTLSPSSVLFMWTELNICVYYNKPSHIHARKSTITRSHFLEFVLDIYTCRGI